MIELLDPIKQCDHCSHTPATPCHQLIECLQGDCGCKENCDCSKQTKELLSRLRRETVIEPIIYVGAATCGLGAGAEATIEAANEWLKDADKPGKIVRGACIGLCVLEPLVDIQLPGTNRLLLKEVTAEKVKDLLDKVFAGQVPETSVLCQIPVAGGRSWDGVVSIDEHPFFSKQTRRVLANCGRINPDSIDEYIAHGGYRALSQTLRNHTPADVCNIVEESGLRGRGGGGFPTGKKWKFALATESDQKYLVCNADEGDPGAFMDRAVIEGDPHRLLEGMAIAAYAIGASKAYVYIRAEYPLAIKRLRLAIDQAKELGLIGHNILDSGFNFDVIIKMGAGAFVCGEETALLHSIEGKRGMPRPRPPYPAVKGLFGKPTVINNVETLANVPGILLHGASWFNSLGTATSKGTKIFALSGKISNTGLVEVAMGTKVREVVFDIGGGIPNGKKYKAVQIGGPSGGCIPEQHLDIEIDYESLKTVGAMMGSGGLVVMDEDTCMVDVAKFFMDFIQRESCGKCIPCREGTRRMLDTLKKITRSTRQEHDRVSSLDRFQSVLYLQRLAETIKDASLCGLGQTAPNPVLSTLRFFRNEYEEHVFERRCPAGVCTDLLTFTINEDACTGCTACQRKCPVDAIMGTRKSPHYIVQDKCVRCGQCLETCRFDAITKE